MGERLVRADAIVRSQGAASLDGARCFWQYRCMIGDREIWACAHQVMQQYGDAAWFHASQRADALFAQGAFEGQRTWLRILRRIEDLEKLEPAGSVQ